jgi:hypothetical protein
MLFRLTRIRYVVHAIMLTWGVWLLAIDPTASSVTLQRFHPHWLWGAVMLTGAVFGLWATTMADRDVFSHRGHMLAVSAAIVAVGDWLFVWIMVIWGNWVSTATVIYGWMVFLSVLNFLDATGLLYIRETRR